MSIRQMWDWSIDFHISVFATHPWPTWEFRQCGPCQSILLLHWEIAVIHNLTMPWDAEDRGDEANTWNGIPSHAVIWKTIAGIELNLAAHMRYLLILAAPNLSWDWLFDSRPTLLLSLHSSSSSSPFCVARFRTEMLCFDLRCVCKLLVLLPSTFNADLHSWHIAEFYDLVKYSLTPLHKFPPPAFNFELKDIFSSLTIN